MKLIPSSSLTSLPESLCEIPQCGDLKRPIRSLVDSEQNRLRIPVPPQAFPYDYMFKCVGLYVIWFVAHRAVPAI